MSPIHALTTPIEGGRRVQVEPLHDSGFVVKLDHGGSMIRQYNNRGEAVSEFIRLTNRGDSIIKVTENDELLLLTKKMGRTYVQFYKPNGI